MICEAYRMLMTSLPALERQGIEITDDAMVVETMLHRHVKLVPASYENIKVTTPEDPVGCLAGIALRVRQLDRVLGGHGRHAGAVGVSGGVGILQYLLCQKGPCPVMDKHKTVLAGSSQPSVLKQLQSVSHGLITLSASHRDIAHFGKTVFPMLHRHVKLVPASYENIKVTTPEDMRIAMALLPSSLFGGQS